jgi:hypothetical protein
MLAIPYGYGLHTIRLSPEDFVMLIKVCCSGIYIQRSCLLSLRSFHTPFN